MCKHSDGSWFIAHGWWHWSPLAFNTLFSSSFSISGFAIFFLLIFCTKTPFHNYSVREFLMKKREVQRMNMCLLPFIIASFILKLTASTILQTKINGYEYRTKHTQKKWWINALPFSIHYYYEMKMDTKQDVFSFVICNEYHNSCWMKLLRKMPLSFGNKRKRSMATTAKDFFFGTTKNDNNVFESGFCANKTMIIRSHFPIGPLKW